MPICTTCTHITPYLYTVYESEHNLRLEQCPNPTCHEFVDPYVEHDSLTILLDLILLKLGVYRHLLYNRGTEPRRLDGKSKATINDETKENKDTATARNKSQKELDRWLLLFQLGTALIFTDAFIRSSYLNSDRVSETTRWTKQTVLAFLRVFFGTAAETLAFHGGITLACYLAMKLMTLFRSWFPPKFIPRSNIRQEFRLSMISFSLFYSSITKLFLLLLLTIWLPTSTQSKEYTHMPLPDWAKLLSNHTSSSNFVMSALKILDDEADREWIVRNILGGMSAGFGLRVILDIHPIFTTIIILAGWVAKTAVAALLSGWVGGNESNQEAWLAYSIP